jgi:hypothetical protein
VLRIVLVALCACGQAAPPSAPPAPQPIGSGSTAATPTSLGCIVLPQPSKPGKTSVEPDDMACTHGDTVYDCPPAFDRDAAGFHCQRSIAHGWWSAARTWCCPGT